MTPSPAQAQTPRRVASILLTFIILHLCYDEYVSYGQQHRHDPNAFMDVVNGTATAPSQYRVGVLKTADFLARHSHPLAIRHWVVLIEMGSAFLSVFTLFYLLRRTAVWRETTDAGRWFGAISFVFLVQFYFGWVMFYDRPETLPTAALVTLVLLLLSVRPRLPGVVGNLAISVGIIALAAVQSFVRADVALATSAGLILYCMTRSSPGLSLTRIPQILTSLVAGLVAFAVQYYLMRVVYPRATYGDTPRYQLMLNFESPGEWIAFTLFMLPFVWTAVSIFRKRVTMEPAARAIFDASLVFIVLWFTFGRMEEVRIFLPMAMAMAPWTVTVAIQRLFGEGRGAVKETALAAS